MLEKFMLFHTCEHQPEPGVILAAPLLRILFHCPKGTVLRFRGIVIAFLRRTNEKGDHYFIVVSIAHMRNMLIYKIRNLILRLGGLQCSFYFVAAPSHERVPKPLTNISHDDRIVSTILLPVHIVPHSF
jgi:hypothetical protein